MAIAWLATYVTALGATAAPGPSASTTTDRFGEREQLILQIGFGEYLAQIKGGLPMSQGEIVRLGRFRPRCRGRLRPLDVAGHLIVAPATLPRKPRALADLIAEGRVRRSRPSMTKPSPSSATSSTRFAEAIVEDAHQWHLKDELIPLEVIEQLAEMGVFGLTVPEEFGGVRHGQARHVRRDRRTLARLYRPGLSGHALGDRGGTDPPRRHRGAEAALAAEASPTARSCRPPSSPNPIPAPISEPAHPRA